MPLCGTDALGRPMPGAGDVPAPRPDRYVGIFYFLWAGSHGTENAVYDISKILAESPRAAQSNTSPPWGPLHSFHFWGEPMYGYYRADDPWVLRRHATLLSDAGVDFLIFDTTNAVIYDAMFLKLCEVFDEQRKAGERVPGVVFMTNTNAGETAQRIYETLYKPGLYPELWFRWKGKPLMICDPEEATEDVKAFFTLRKAHWPFKMIDTHNAWHWEAVYPQPYSYDEDPARPEQLDVSVGQNLAQDYGPRGVEMMSSDLARGRSFHGKAMDDRPEAWKYGFNFEEQWQRAFELDPEVVFVTGWNEWMATQLNADPGPVVFCDQYNLEFSRDVEMMKGGYGDNYYIQMAANIRRFKGVAPVAAASDAKTIDIAGSFARWDDIAPEYRDHAFETRPRDHAGCGDYHYTVNTGRNEFETLKVARDDQNLYFYAQTQDAVSPHTDANWMWLFIDVKHGGRMDWEGFQYIVNRQVTDAGRTSVEVSIGGWEWRSVGTASYRVEGNKLHVAVPRAMIEVPEGPFAIEFKWIDNAQEPGNILDTYINGDAAPAGRFRYRYEAGS